MRTRIMSSRQVERTLNRLAYQIVERNRGAENLVILGILQSGAILADRLVDDINRIEDHDLTSFGLDTASYRDDRADELADTQQLPDLTDKDVILVDDVLFTGRTVRAALDAVIQFGRPRSIQLAVLIDRGHREFPIQPDYTGRIMPTKHREQVVVQTSPEFGVDVVEGQGD